MIIICLLSCRNKEATHNILDSNDTISSENHKVYNDSISNPCLPDSFKIMDVDDYPVTNQMLSDSTHNAYKKQVGEVFSLDQAGLPIILYLKHWFLKYILTIGE